jgi:hypothetical protein
VRFRFKIQGTIFAGDEDDAEGFLQDSLIEAEPKNTIKEIEILCLEEIEEEDITRRTGLSVYDL